MGKITLVLEFDEDVVQEILKEIVACYGIEISDEQLGKIIQNEPKFAAEIFEMGGIDTLAREDLIKFVLKYILEMNMSWPKYGDTDEYTKKFQEQLKITATLKNVKLH